MYQVPKYTKEHIAAETERIHLSSSKDEQKPKHKCTAEELSGSAGNHCPVNSKGPT
jgi:hypothetical protein